MIRQVYTIFFLLLSFSAKSQLNKGTWLVGGSGGFSSGKETFVNNSTNTSISNTNSTNTNIGISTNIGYFIIDKLAVGLSPYYGLAKSSTYLQDGTPEATSNTVHYEIGPFVKYYFLDSEKPFNFFVETSYQLGIIRDGYFLGNPAQGSVNNFSISCGPVIYFNSSVGLEFAVGYDRYKESVFSIGPNYITTSLQISIGFQIHLTK